MSCQVEECDNAPDYNLTYEFEGNIIYCKMCEDHYDAFERQINTGSPTTTVNRIS